MFDVVKKINSIITKRQKKYVALIVVMMIISGVLETLGVSIIIPIISIITAPEEMMKNTVVLVVCGKSGIETPQQVMILLIFGMMLLFLLKNLYGMLLMYIQTRFVFNSQYTLREQMFEKMLKKPYAYFLDKDSSLVIKMMTNDIRNVFGILLALMSMMSELIIFVFLVVTIMIVNPFMTCVVSALLLTTVLVSTKRLRFRVEEWGKSALNESAVMHKWLLQSLQGIKDVKIGLNEKYFAERYNESSLRFTRSERNNNFLSCVPRLLTETIFMVGMLGVILVLLLCEVEMTNLLPQLSAFAIAAIRLMPSANRVIGHWNGIVYEQASLDTVLEWRQNIMSEENYALTYDVKEGIGLTSEILLQNVTYRYPNVEEYVIKNANMLIRAGQAIGIVGVSGAGKTTLVDMIIGLLEPTKGNILVDGMDIKSKRAEWLATIGYIPQFIYFIDDTIKANVGLGLQDKDIDENQVWRALEEAQIADYVRSLPDGIHTSIGERGIRLSGGQRQRLGIARALYKEPQVLVFDEATSALDNETEAAIIESINKLHGQKTMIIIAHRLTTIRNCDLVYRVQGGEVIVET